MYELLQAKTTAMVMPQPKQRKGKGAQLSSRTPVKWAEEHQRALDQFIRILSNPPVLDYPDFDLPFVLHTDASEQGLGAVLYQRQGGKLRVIAYGSRTLTPAERNYNLHFCMSGENSISKMVCYTGKPVKGVNWSCPTSSELWS